MNRLLHWEKVYLTKQPEDVGWTQKVPHPSLKMIKDLGLPKSSSIIDIGGGDSHLVDYLLKDGFTDISVLDISSTGIEKAKKRLGKKADKVDWLVTDILDFEPQRSYDLWHDRAAFHFLTEGDHIDRYQKTVAQCVNKHLAIGTFSVDGPKKCSGLPIRQYDEVLIAKTFYDGFRLLSTFRDDHHTPSGNIQNFIFATFGKVL